MGELVAGGAIDREAASEVLLEAARERDIPDDEAADAIEWGLAAGAENPRNPGPRLAPASITRPKSDPQLARAARDALGASVVSAEGTLWRLDGAIWTRVEDAELHAAVVALDGLSVEVGVGKDGATKMVTISLSATRIRGIAGLATDLDRIADHFAPASGGIAVGDEWITVDADGLRREPLTADHRARWRIDAASDALDGVPTRFLATLREMLTDSSGAGPEDSDDILTAIGETIGLALVGRGAESDARHLLLCGPRAGGKTTVLRIVSSLVPPDAQTSMTLHDLTERFRPAALVGARLVLCPELPARDLLEVERAKAVLTGDVITVEKKYRDPVTIRPAAGWIVAANELPAAPDASQAIFRRFLLVDLRRQYPVTLRDYAAEIIAAERPAIVGWALRCAAGALARGERLLPASCQRSVEQWARDSDPVLEWLAERTIADADARTSRDVAWSDYRAFAESRGCRPVGFATFRRRLAAAGIRGSTDPRGGLPLRLAAGAAYLPTGPMTPATAAAIVARLDAAPHSRPS